MNTAEMADRLKMRTGRGKAIASDAVDDVFAIIDQPLAHGEEVRITSSGVFRTRGRPTRYRTELQDRRGDVEIRVEMGPATPASNFCATISLPQKAETEMTGRSASAGVGRITLISVLGRHQSHQVASECAPGPRLDGEGSSFVLAMVKPPYGTEDHGKALAGGI